MQIKKIGYLSLIESEDSDVYIGALLITDEFGIPLEFKCTHSVRPTPIQKTLYGERLKPYIGTNLCGIPLLKSNSVIPDIIFIDTPFLIDLAANTDIPTFFIKRGGDVINIETIEDVKMKIENRSGLFNPVIVQNLSNINRELDYNTEFNELFETFDIFEPFERVRKSVEILGRMDAKFK